METIYSKIEEIVKVELQKRGFFVNVVCEQTKTAFKIKTSEFQTTPVLFKRVWIESWATNIEDKKSERGLKYADYYLTLSVFYEQFNGGRNAVDLLRMSLRKLGNQEDLRIISMY